MQGPRQAFAAKTLRKHRREFKMHSEVASFVEDGLLGRSRYPSNAHVVLDMLLVQSLKAHAAVSLLAQDGLMEDTATLARRTLELSLQAVYIGMEGDERLQRRRAGSYLAFLWRQVPRATKRCLPSSGAETLEWNSEGLRPLRARQGQAVGA